MLTSSNMLSEIDEKIMELSIIPIVGITEKGVVKVFNSAAEHIFGCKREEIIDQKVNMLMPENLSSVHDEYMQKYMTTRVKRVVDRNRVVTAKRVHTNELFALELKITEIKKDNSQFFIGFVRESSANGSAEKFASLTKQVYPEMIVHRMAKRELVYDFCSTATVAICKRTYKQGKHVMLFTNHKLSFSTRIVWSAWR